MNLFTKLVISLVTAALAAVVITQFHLTSTVYIGLVIAAATVGTTFASLVKLSAPAAASSAAAKPVKKPVKEKNSRGTKQKENKTAPKKQASSKSDAAREEGEVKWFNVSKGFGFIVRDNGEEIFVHFRSIRGDSSDRRSLRDGQRVTFALAESDKGPQAEDVEPL